MEFQRRWSLWNVILIAIIWLLVTYIAVLTIFRKDELQPATHPSVGPLPDQGSILRWRSEAERRGGDGNGKCNTRDGYFEDDSADIQEYAWRQMKWIGQPAACPVRGELIERLDVLNNFRRGFALRFSDNVEDRTHILPWLLGSKVDLNRRNRRVYLDLGANRFSSSIEWFMQMYPCDFTEVHAFEIQDDLLQLPKPFDESGNRAPGNPSSRRTITKPGLSRWMLKRIHVYKKLVSDGDDVGRNAVNITRFIKEELKLSADDTVIVKMDIEESEWPILTRWMKDFEMVQIVDEIFVEVHYKHPSMYSYNWRKFRRQREDAKRLLADLRWKGFYIHFWP